MGKQKKKGKEKLGKKEKEKEKIKKRKRNPCRLSCCCLVPRVTWCVPAGLAPLSLTSPPSSQWVELREPLQGARHAVQRLQYFFQGEKKEEEKEKEENGKGGKKEAATSPLAIWKSTVSRVCSRAAGGTEPQPVREVPGWGMAQPSLPCSDRAPKLPSCLLLFNRQVPRGFAT